MGLARYGFAISVITKEDHVEVDLVHLPNQNVLLTLLLVGMIAVHPMNYVVMVNVSLHALTNIVMDAIVLKAIPNVHPVKTINAQVMQIVVKQQPQPQLPVVQPLLLLQVAAMNAQAEKSIIDAMEMFCKKELAEIMMQTIAWNGVPGKQ